MEPVRQSNQVKRRSRKLYPIAEEMIYAVEVSIRVRCVCGLVSVCVCVRVHVCVRA